MFKDTFVRQFFLLYWIEKRSHECALDISYVNKETYNDIG